MKTVLLVILIIIFSLEISLIIDDECFNMKYRNKIVFDSDCNFVIPKGFSVLYNSETNKFAVMESSWDGYFLVTRYSDNNIIGMFQNIREPSLFNDTCAAKGYLKEYLIQQHPKPKPVLKFQQQTINQIN